MKVDIVHALRVLAVVMAVGYIAGLAAWLCVTAW